jgi:hypothetical protein
LAIPWVQVELKYLVIRFDTLPPALAERGYADDWGIRRGR